MESEYVACLAVAQEAVWLKRFFQSLRVTSLADEAIKMYCDSLPTGIEGTREIFGAV